MCDSVLENKEYLHYILHKYSVLSELDGELKLVLELKNRFFDNEELIQYLIDKEVYIRTLQECYGRNYEI